MLEAHGIILGSLTLNLRGDTIWALSLNPMFKSKYFVMEQVLLFVLESQIPARTNRKLYKPVKTYGTVLLC